MYVCMYVVGTAENQYFYTDAISPLPKKNDIETAILNECQSTATVTYHFLSGIVKVPLSCQGN